MGNVKLDEPIENNDNDDNKSINSDEENEAE